MIEKLPTKGPCARFNSRWAALAKSPPARIAQFLEEAGFENIEAALAALLEDINRTALASRATGEIDIAVELEQLAAQILATLRGDA